MIDEASQKFYRKQMHRPVRRVIKRISPLVIAASIAWGVMLTVFLLIPSTLIKSGTSSTVVIHSLSAILISAGVISWGHFLAFRRQSKFQPIRVRIAPKSPPFDN